MKRSSRITTLVTALMVVGALMACKKSKGSAEESGSTASGSSANSTGIAECDDYLNKYEKCVDEKVPEVARPGIKQGIDKIRETYKTSAANPVAKAGLAAGCTQALEQTKTAMAQYNCTW